MRNGPSTNAMHDLLKIGDFARIADTNLRTLRYYEELGLIQPATRSQGGFRYYRRTDIHRVRMIRDLQDLGLALERIGDLLAARTVDEPREPFLSRVQQALLEQDRLLKERMSKLEEQSARVGLALKKLGECRMCALSPGHQNNFCEPCSQTGDTLPEHLSALYQ